MNLKNYTLEVPAQTSMNRIEKALVAAGATDISKGYKDGICVDIKFRIMHNGLPMFFKLPAQVEACFTILWKDVKRPQPGTQERIKAQAERTAWKIISDWVECQLSMIMLQQAEMLQVFLPYAYDQQKDQIFFEQIKEGNFKALLPSSN